MEENNEALNINRKAKLKEKLAQIEGDEDCQMEVLKTRIRRFKKDLNKIKIDEIDSLGMNRSL